MKPKARQSFDDDLRDYVRMMRPQHWFKNALILPGVMAAANATDAGLSSISPRVLAAFLGACLMTSANYVLNEWLDAPSDAFHPFKKTRPAVTRTLPARTVFFEYSVLLGISIGLGLVVSLPLTVGLVMLALQGIVYNVPPLRAKDDRYLDVLVESLNNPIRFMLGWWAISITALPDVSLLFAAWAVAAYWMSIKRYAEWRSFADRAAAKKYRRSLGLYTEKQLLVLSGLCGFAFFIFFGVYACHQDPRLLVCAPFLLVLLIWYFLIGRKTDSVAKSPERLHEEKAFYVFCVLVLVGVSLLLYAGPKVLMF